MKPKLIVDISLFPKAERDKYKLIKPLSLDLKNLIFFKPNNISTSSKELNIIKTREKDIYSDINRPHKPIFSPVVDLDKPLSMDNEAEDILVGRPREPVISSNKDQKSFLLNKDLLNPYNKLLAKAIL